MFLNKRKIMKLFESLKQEDLQKVGLVREKLQKIELMRYKFTKKEYDEILSYCVKLGYVSHKKIDGELVLKNGRPIISSPSINEQMKTVKIFNSKTRKWGYLQKLRNGIYYGYFSNDSKGNAVFVPKYSFAESLMTFKLMIGIEGITLPQLKLACGIVELEQ